MENTIIQASAGTGKTHQLACRYLLLLFSGVRPESILATTFTKKAAGEILNRILLWLAIGATDETKCAKLADALTKAKELTQDNDKAPVKLTLDEVRRMLYEVIKNLNRVNVSTLDSYFNQLAGCFSLELKLPSDWQIMEDSQDYAYRQKAMSSMFEDDKIVHRYTQFLENSDLKASVFKQMSFNIDAMYSLWREAPAKAWDALQVPTQYLLKEDEFQELLNHTLFQVETDAIFTANEKDKHLKELESLRNPKTRFAAAMKMFEHVLIKALLNATPEDGIYINKKRSITPQNDPETFSALIAIAKYVHAYLLDVWKKQSDFYRDTLQIFDSLYTDSKKKDGQLRFEDIPCFLLEQKFSDRQNEASFRMDGAIQHLMLDEFQDTSLVQWRILESLAQKTSQNENCSFFCVGDSKQAIYGWRGGEAQLLVTLDDTLKPAIIAKKDMIKSFRSKPVILEAVNKVFQNIDSNPALADYTNLSGGKPIWGRAFINHESSTIISSQKDNNLLSYVELRTAPYSEDADEDDKNHIDSLRKMTYKYIAENIIQQLHEDAQKLNLEIGILVRKNASGSEIADCIKKLGIECSLEGETDLLDSFEVRQILALLQWIDHPGDVYSYYVVSQSTLAKSLGIDGRWKTSLDDEHCIVIPFEDAEKLNRIRYDLFHNGYGVTIQRWVDLLKPEADEPSRRRLEMLEELANKYDSQGSTRTDDFIEYINKTSVQDAFKTRIRIMTYHQSKGLQFDIVVLPDLDVELLKTDSDPVVYGRKTPIDLPNEIVRSVKEDCRFLLPPTQQKLFRDAKLQALQESLCNLYVAMTRAKTALYMVLSPPKTTRNSSKTYGGVVMEALAPNETKEADKVYYADGDPNWIKNALIKAGAENSQQKPSETASNNIVEVDADFHFLPGGRSICVPLPATSWEPVSKDYSFIETVTVKIDGSEKTGASLPQNMRGTLFHYWLADIDCIEDYRVDDQRLKDLGVELGLKESSFTDYLAPFRSLLGNPAVISALSRPDASWDVYREKNAAAILDAPDNSGNQYLVSGVFDRLTVHRTQGRVDEAIVVDFKTVFNGVKKADVLERYAGQMDAYRQIVSKMYNIPLNSVKIKLLILEGNF